MRKEGWEIKRGPLRKKNEEEGREGDKRAVEGNEEYTRKNEVKMDV